MHTIRHSATDISIQGVADDLSSNGLMMLSFRFVI